ncbi:hypothetical protein Ocin01_01492 [Orchesella cincta]|uniref:Fe2OG dioxygenase domain-containing protein n=1 Tax=Orchesella cincta TaxID=48709 RepID=A0A1D2NJ10_ORCCI|nr:hypothetical protein Ocin01_01492 [Orchesella cincta]
MAALNQIPIVQLQELESRHGQERLAHTLVKAFHDIGFVYIVNHGIPEAKIKAAFSASKNFFERPLGDKLRFRRSNATEGYHGAYGVDEITNSSLKNVQSQPFDFRESFDFFGDTDFISQTSENKIDKEFCESMLELQDACHPLCTTLMKLLGIGLELDDEEYFINRSKWLQIDNKEQSYKTFRALYYPSIPENVEIPTGQARVKTHSDHGFLTLLFQDDVGGLEVQGTSGNWIAAEPLPESVIVNIGDLLEFWSGGFLRATKHRVLIPEREIQRRVSRQSIVYFLHPDANANLSPLVSKCIGKYDFRSILASDFAKAKLAAYIPVVDLSKLTENDSISDTDWTLTAKEIFQALSGIGFAYLSNHGISNKIIDQAFSASRKFFELPEEVKDKSVKDISKSYNGYAKPGQELLNAGSTFEIRESYDFCGNLRYYPKACNEFGPALTALEEASKPLIKNLLRTLAISLELEDKDYFVTRSKCLNDLNIESYSTFRTLYYPPIGDNIPPGTVRCADHTDYGILTLLFQDNMGGLEVKSVSGKWVPANPIPGTILLNTGDLLEFWSGGKFPATHHQVMIPEAETKRRTARQSIVYFVHPDDDVCVSPLTGNSAEYTTVTAKEHAQQKLSSTYKY